MPVPAPRPKRETSNTALAAQASSADRPDLLAAQASSTHRPDLLAAQASSADRPGLLATGGLDWPLGLLSA